MFAAPEGLLLRGTIVSGAASALLFHVTRFRGVWKPAEFRNRGGGRVRMSMWMCRRPGQAGSAPSRKLVPVAGETGSHIWRRCSVSADVFAPAALSGEQLPAYINSVKEISPS